MIAATNTPMTIAIPPTRGIGMACTLRTPGLSTMPQRVAARPNTGSHAMVTTMAKRKGMTYTMRPNQERNE